MMISKFIDSASKKQKAIAIDINYSFSPVSKKSLQLKRTTTVTLYDITDLETYSNLREVASVMSTGVVHQHPNDKDDKPYARRRALELAVSNANLNKEARTAIYTTFISSVKNIGSSYKSTED